MKESYIFFFVVIYLSTIYIHCISHRKTLILSRRQVSKVKRITMGDSDEDFEGSSSRQRRGKFRNEREDFNKRDNFRQADRSTSENNFNRPHNNSRHNNNHGNYRRNGGDKSPKLYNFLLRYDVIYTYL